MERLPNETLDNAIKVYESTLEATKGMSEDELDDYNPVLDKVIINFLKELKAYRRIGLTPEQIIAIDEEYAKLARELGEYKRLEEQGRLIKLLCEVGDTVYHECPYSTWLVGVQSYQITNIMISQNKKGEWTRKYRAMLLRNGKIADKQINFEFNDIGKTVFLTKAEAEKALEEMEE